MVENNNFENENLNEEIENQGSLKGIDPNMYQHSFFQEVENRNHQHLPNLETGNVYPQQYEGNVGNPYVNQYEKVNQENDPTQKVKGWRVWLVSIGFSILHVFVLNMAAIIVMIFMMVGQDISITNPMALNEILLGSKMQNYASIIMACICIPIYLIFMVKRNKKYSQSLANRKLSGTSFVTMNIGSFGALGLVTLFLILLEYMGKWIPMITRWFDNYQDLIDSVVTGDESIFLQIIGTVILVPIAEELLFRGIIMGELNLRYSPKVVVFVQAVLFGLFHMNPIQSFYTFIPGLFLGIAYYKTRNIIIPIIGHIIFNFFGGIMNFLVPEATLSIISIVQIVVSIFTMLVILQFFIPKYKFNKQIALEKVEKDVKAE